MPENNKNPADCANNRQGILENQTRLLTLILGSFIVGQSPTKGKDTMEPREIKGLEIAAKTQADPQGQEQHLACPVADYEGTKVHRCRER